MCITHYVRLRHSTDVAIREHFPLILGWAITVHRVQGIAISSNVFVVLDSIFFASGQPSVQLSRVKKYAQLHLLAFDSDNAIIVSNVGCLYGLQPLMQSSAVHVEPTSLCIHPKTIQPSPCTKHLHQFRYKNEAECTLKPFSLVPALELMEMLWSV